MITDMNQESNTPTPEEQSDRRNPYADLGGRTDKGEAAREKIRRDIADRAAQRQEEKENSPDAQAARLRAELARKYSQEALTEDK